MGLDPMSPDELDSAADSGGFIRGSRDPDPSPARDGGGVDEVKPWKKSATDPLKRVIKRGVESQPRRELPDQD